MGGRFGFAPPARNIWPVRRAVGSEEEINTGNLYRSEANRSTDLFMPLQGLPEESK
jgi:hypothetical protein